MAKWSFPIGTTKFWPLKARMVICIHHSPFPLSFSTRTWKSAIKSWKNKVKPASPLICIGTEYFPSFTNLLELQIFFGQFALSTISNTTSYSNGRACIVTRSWEGEGVRRFESLPELIGKPWYPDTQIPIYPQKCPASYCVRYYSCIIYYEKNPGHRKLLVFYAHIG